MEKTDKWAWLKRSDHNYLLPFVIVVTAVVALWLLFFAHNSVLNWVKASVEEKNQEAEMARLQAKTIQSGLLLRAFLIKSGTETFEVNSSTIHEVKSILLLCLKNSSS